MLSVLPHKKTSKQQKQTVATGVYILTSRWKFEVASLDLKHSERRHQLLSSTAAKLYFSCCVPPTLHLWAPSAT